MFVANGYPRKLHGAILETSDADHIVLWTFISSLFFAFLSKISTHVMEFLDMDDFKQCQSSGSLLNKGNTLFLIRKCFIEVFIRDYTQKAQKLQYWISET